MRAASLVLSLALAVLCGCHLLLPAVTPPAEDGAPRAANCTLDLAEARRTAVTRIAAAGTTRPLVISLSPRAGRDRLLRNGERIELNHFASADESAGSGARGATPPLTIVAVGSDTAIPAPIRDGSLVRLTTTAAGAVIGPVQIYKVDVPDPNRPTSCDAQLRDGDFVLLRVESPSAWLALQAGRLTVRAAPAAGSCSRSREYCYTDRYGGLLCVRYLGCAAPD